MFFVGLRWNRTGTSKPRAGPGTWAVLVSGPCPRSAAAECSSPSSPTSRSFSRCPRCRGPSCSSLRTRPRAHRSGLVPRAKRSRSPPRDETPAAACSSRRSKSRNGSRLPVQPSVVGAPSSVGGLVRRTIRRLPPKTLTRSSRSCWCRRPPGEVCHFHHSDRAEVSNAESRTLRHRSQGRCILPDHARRRPKLIVNHEKGGFKEGLLTIEVSKFMGFSSTVSSRAS